MNLERCIEIHFMCYFHLFLYARVCKTHIPVLCTRILVENIQYLSNVSDKDYYSFLFSRGSTLQCSLCHGGPSTCPLCLGEEGERSMAQVSL